MSRADSVQLTRLMVEAAQLPDDLTCLNGHLASVRRWTATKAGGMTPEERAGRALLGRPLDGRGSGAYPGVPRASLNRRQAAGLRHPPADNEAHFRFIMLVHSGLYELKMPYTRFARTARISQTQMRRLLHGEVWGTAESRERLLWHLLVEMLVAWGLQRTVTFAENGGNWLPQDIAEPEWFAQDGYVRVQSTAGVAGTARVSPLQVFVVLPGTALPGHRNHPQVTLQWPDRPGAP